VPQTPGSLCYGRHRHDVTTVMNRVSPHAFNSFVHHSRSIRYAKEKCGNHIVQVKPCQQQTLANTCNGTNLTWMDNVRTYLSAAPLTQSLNNLAVSATAANRLRWKTAAASRFQTTH